MTDKNLSQTTCEERKPGVVIPEPAGTADNQVAITDKPAIFTGKAAWLVLVVFLMLLFTAPQLEAQNPGFSPEAADLYQEAMNALRMRRLSVARQQLKEVIEKFPDDIHASMARRQMAGILRDLKEYDQAVELLTETIKNDGSEDNVRLAREELLDLLFELQRFKQGVELIEGWRRDDPQNVLLGRSLARFYLQSGRKDEAWLLLETLVETGNAPDAFRDLLELAVRSGEIEKVLQTLESRRARYRSNVFADYVSDCHIALGRKDKAIAVIMEVSDLQNHLLLLRKLADLQIDTDAIDSAVTTLDMVLRILPDDWATLRRMGHCRFVQNRREEALEIWRRPLNRPYMPAREFFTEFTTVLIEHQLYEEALKAFDEARSLLQDQTLFSEEKASVLDAVGRREEALEEYLQVLAAGFFKPEVFEKLYEAKVSGFSLETRLLQMQKADYNPGIMQALLEFYFRRADEKDIDKIVEIVKTADGGFDYAFFDRLKQDALLMPADFHFALTDRVMQARQETTLELMLSSLLLKMAQMEDKWQQPAFVAANRVFSAGRVADADLKATLLIDMARFSLEVFHDGASAHKYIDAILQTDLMRAAPGQALVAAILKAQVFIYEENFSAATSLLTETGKKLEQSDFSALDLGAVAINDYSSMVMLENARLAAHSGDFQKALGELKNIVEKNPEGEYVNDALEMALYITRRSIGDFSLIRHALKAERLKFTGKHDQAAAELQEGIGKNASATALIGEMKAEQILLRRNASDSAQLLEDIDTCLAGDSGGFKSADLLELKLRLLKKTGASETETREGLQKFVESFPSDLRSGRYRKILAVMNGTSGVEKK